MTHRDRSQFAARIRNGEQLSPAEREVVAHELENGTSIAEIASKFEMRVVNGRVPMSKERHKL